MIAAEVLAGRRVGQSGLTSRNSTRIVWRYCTVMVTDGTIQDASCQVPSTGREVMRLQGSSCDGCAVTRIGESCTTSVNNSHFLGVICGMTDAIIERTPGWRRRGVTGAEDGGSSPSISSGQQAAGTSSVGLVGPTSQNNAYFAGAIFKITDATVQEACQPLVTRQQRTSGHVAQGCRDCEGAYPAGLAGPDVTRALGHDGAA